MTSNEDDGYGEFEENQSFQENFYAQKRVWRRIPKIERLKLEVCVDFGLSVDFSGKLIGMSSRNANRIMKEQVTRRTQATQKLKQIVNPEVLATIENKDLIEIEQDGEYPQAKLESLLVVMAARETGLISKRNMVKLDAKMNLNIAKGLSQLTPSPQHTLPETISANSFGIKALRKLPIPDPVLRATAGSTKNSQRKQLSE